MNFKRANYVEEPFGSGLNKAELFIQILKIRRSYKLVSIIDL
jgi:hypothetical protein